MKALRGLSVTPKQGSTPAVKLADPKDADWTGYWGKVKDQGQCGAGWAFSAAATIEARYHIKLGKRSVETYFSEQQFIDCASRAHGCNGGWVPAAFDYLNENRQFCSETQYPFKGVAAECQEIKCRGPFFDVLDEPSYWTSILNKNKFIYLNFDCPY